MKTRKRSMIILAAALALAGIACLLWVLLPQPRPVAVVWPTENETNTVMSHFTFFSLNRGSFGKRVPASIDDIIPAKDTLTAALEEKGYEIEEFVTALDSGIPAQRVCAHKGRQFVDICYGLTRSQAKEVLPRYEAAYEDFILMAQNEQYVYCISDKQAFEDAGFTSLANIGMQYIRVKR
ncbi:MAG: hypothetical protein FWF60_03645 [Oscillospiraceae bacterium]|nr:hypothetical protein [Oscillospiraceae bacterium]